MAWCSVKAQGQLYLFFTFTVCTTTQAKDAKGISPISHCKTWAKVMNDVHIWDLTANIAQL
jgi:hypothetical protein